MTHEYRPVGGASGFVAGRPRLQPDMNPRVITQALSLSEVEPLRQRSCARVGFLNGRELVQHRAKGALVFGAGGCTLRFVNRVNVPQHPRGLLRFEACILPELIALRADFAGLAESTCELDVGVSRVEVEMARLQMEIAQMKLMFARRQRVLAERAADLARVPLCGAPDTTGKA